MSLPDIQISGGIMLVDIRDNLRIHPNKSYTKRRPESIKTLFIHHSGADTGRDGVEAVKPMADWHVLHNGWAGIGYQFVIPRRAEIPYKSRDELVIYLVGGEDTVRAHTRLCNRFGTGLCLQGHLGLEKPSWSQIECLEAFIPWWMDLHKRNPKRDLGWHSNCIKWGGVPKPACPGKYAIEWLKSYQAKC